MTYLAGVLVTDIIAGAPNQGEGDATSSRTKKMGAGRDTRPYVSAPAFRRWHRTSLPTEPSPVFRTGKGKKQQAYTAGRPDLYPDDDIYGYMAATAKQDGDKTTRSRETALFTSPLLATGPTRIVEDFGTMSRGFEADADPVLHGREQYTADLACRFLVDSARLGRFTIGGEAPRMNLRGAAVDEAKEAGAVEGEFRGAEIVELPIEQRRERLAMLLEAFSGLHGGAMQALHYNDVTPAWMLLAPVRGGINPFTRVVTHNGSETVVDLAVLREEIEAHDDVIDGVVRIGWAPGFLPEQRAQAAEQLPAGVTLDHPRTVVRNLAQEIRDGAADLLLND